MTETDAGTDGRKPGRPRSGLIRGETPASARGRSLALVLIVIGGAMATAAGGTAISQVTERPAARSEQPSAPNDPRAGEVLLLPSPKGVKIPGARAVRPPLAAPDLKAAAAIAIHIPRMKIHRQLVGLRVQSDRSLTVPQDFDDVGWWSGGPHPGGPGAALFAGHVNNYNRAAVFAGLKTLRAGDLITVDRNDQTSAVFKVVGRASFPRTTFPDEVVYRTAGKPSIHLVTCDGAFNARTRHHSDNLVVFADLVTTRQTKKAKR